MVAPPPKNSEIKVIEGDATTTEYQYMAMPSKIIICSSFS